jgi:hypothetical protein
MWNFCHVNRKKGRMEEKRQREERDDQKFEVR